MRRLLPLLSLSSLVLAAAPTIADASVEVYHDEDRLRSGVSAEAEAGPCQAHAGVEYFDNDGDHLPDTVPPGGPPPRIDRDASCF